MGEILHVDETNLFLQVLLPAAWFSRGSVALFRDPRVDLINPDFYSELDGDSLMFYHALVQQPLDGVR